MLQLPSNGNYVVSSFSWHNGTAANAGAATWGNGTTGVTGTVSAVNSLVGATTDDYVGNVTALSNGNYVVDSPNWNNGVVTHAGAVTWASGTTGVTGIVSTVNSLVGSTINDNVGYNGVTALSNGNYVVRSSFWNNGAATQTGAVTWGNGTLGMTGTVSMTNSLVGSTTHDYVGYDSVIALSNGNYVVDSSLWNNGTATRAGAVTWGNGTTGMTGTVSMTNSLVGSTSDDQMSNSVTIYPTATMW